MSPIPLIAGATKGDITATAPMLIALGLAAGFLAAAAALLWSASRTAEARSRGDRDDRLRALDELAAAGLSPDEYAKLRTTVLREG